MVVSRETGILAGVLVFTLTVVVTFLLLLFGGSFKRMKEQAEAYESMGEGGLQQSLRPRPYLYDELLEAARKLPRKPDIPKADDGVLEGWYTRLRPLVTRDAEELFEASNGSTKLGLAYDPDQIWNLSPYGPFSSSKELEKSRLLSDPPDGLRFKVIDQMTQSTIGMASILANDPSNLRAEIGDVWLNPSFQASPSTRDALHTLLTHLFGLGYRRVEMRLDAGDKRGRVEAERSGFVMEGVLRKHMVVKGRNRDTALLSVLNSDWGGGGLCQTLGESLRKDAEEAGYPSRRAMGGGERSRPGEAPAARASDSVAQGAAGGALGQGTVGGGKLPLPVATGSETPVSGGKGAPVTGGVVPKMEGPGSGAAR